jgi:hypothetical protein
MSTVDLYHTTAKENSKLSRKHGNADDIRDTKCLQTDAGSNFLREEEGEKIQWNDIFYLSCEGASIVLEEPSFFREYFERT